MPDLDSLWVTLEIAGSDVDPKALTKELGVSPTRSRPHGYWILETRGHVSNTKLVSHLEWLAQRLSNHRSRLAALGKTGKARLLVRGHPDSWELETDAFVIASEQLGLQPTFVVFVPGARDVVVDEVRYKSE